MNNAKKQKGSLSQLSGLLDDTIQAEPLDGASNLIGVENIERNPYQPRKVFDEALLRELSESIKIHGVMSPIVLRKFGDVYQIIAGERRWRAAIMAGVTEIPAVIRDASDMQMATLALVENLVREDLTPMEEADALNTLKNEFSLTQKELADGVSKPLTYVSEVLALSNLPKELSGYYGSVSVSPRVFSRLRTCLKLDKAKTLAFLDSSETVTIRSADALMSMLKSSDGSVAKTNKSKTPALKKSKGAKSGSRVGDADNDSSDEKTNLLSAVSNTLPNETNEFLEAKLFKLCESHPSKITTKKLVKELLLLIESRKTLPV